MTDILKLYAADTANGHKAAVVLEELNLPYEVCSVDLMSGEHQSDEYRKINPAGKIPVLDMPSQRIYGSLAIALTLCQEHQKLIPDPADGKFYEVLSLVATDLAPALSGQFMFSVIIPDKPASAVEYFTNECVRYLQVLENCLDTRDYLGAEQYSLADAMAFPNVAVSASRLMPPEELTRQFPQLVAWRDRISTRQSIKRALLACKGKR